MATIKKLLLDTTKKHVNDFEQNTNKSEYANDCTICSAHIIDDIQYDITVCFSNYSDDARFNKDSFTITICFAFEDMRDSNNPVYLLKFDGELTEENLADLESKFNNIISRFGNIKKEMKALMEETGLKRERF